MSEVIKWCRLIYVLNGSTKKYLPKGHWCLILFIIGSARHAYWMHIMGVMHNYTFSLEKSIPLWSEQQKECFDSLFAGILVLFSMLEYPSCVRQEEILRKGQYPKINTTQKYNAHCTKKYTEDKTDFCSTNMHYM